MSQYKIKLNNELCSFNSREVLGKDIIKCIDGNFDTLVLVARGEKREVVSLDSVVDLGTEGTERFEAFDSATAKTFSLNSKVFYTNDSELSVKSILEYAGLFPQNDYYLGIEEGTGNAIYLSRDTDVNISALQGKNLLALLKDEAYSIKVGGTRYFFSDDKVMGEKILTTAGKLPITEYQLVQKFQGKRRELIAPDDIVDLAEPKIEKFVVVPCDQTEGSELRRNFTLPDVDTNFLESLGNDFELVTENNVNRVVVKNFKVLPGYKQTEVDFNVRIEKLYPDVQIDMVYFYPHLERLDGKPIKAIAQDSFDGKSWQRWSRHRTAKHPWKPGVDNLETHYTCIQSWLERELLK